MEKTCGTCAHFGESGPTCMECFSAAAFSGDHKHWTMKKDEEKNMGEKKALKQLVREALDMALVDHRADLVVSGQECSIAVSTYENKVSGVRLSFPGGVLLLHGRNNTLKEMVKLFTSFLWTNIYNG